MVLTRERVDELVKDDRVHVSIYNNEELFQEELKRIFYTTWVYLGHESEISEPGDYKATHIGLVPVMVSRGEDGQVNGLINPNMHRGYGPTEVMESELGLARIPRVDTYRGLIFGSMAAGGDSLPDYLGLAKEYLDDLMDRSPVGEIVVGAGGTWHHTYPGNWKLQVEGSNEGYHTSFLHRVAGLAAERTAGAQPPVRASLIASKNQGVDLGNGHSVMEHATVLEEVWRRRNPKEYVARLEAQHGPERLQVLLGRPWRLVLFPNLAFSNNQVRVIRPISVNQSEIQQYHLSYKGWPQELETPHVAGHSSFNGPAGFGSPDDIEIFTRMQEGYRAGLVHEKTQWALFNRGYTTETRGPNGERIAHTSSEVEQRSIYYAWRALMKGQSQVSIAGK